MKKKWFEVKPGQTSAMRVMTMIGLLSGIVFAFSGVYGILIQKNADAINLFWGGIGFAGACLTGKKFQKDKEIIGNENQG